MSSPVARVQMSAEEKTAALCLRNVRMMPASFERRFRDWIIQRSESSNPTISEKECSQLWRLFVRYRAQITHPQKEFLLKLGEPLAAPDLKKVAAAERDQARIDEMKRRWADATKAEAREREEAGRVKRVFDLE